MVPTNTMRRYYVAVMVCALVAAILAKKTCPIKYKCSCDERIVSEDGKNMRVIDVNCGGLGLMDIPKIMWTMLPPNTRIDTISLNDNGLNTIPEDVFAVLKPRVINLSNNDLGVVEINAFYGLEYTLEELNLSRNRRYVFPKSLVLGLKVLRHLDISESKPGDAYFKDQTFPKSRSLQSLDMHKCHVQGLNTDFFDQLFNLKHLNLSDNEFDTVPDAVKKCTGLEKLDLKGNYIEELNDGDLDSLTNLKFLDLSGIQFTEFTPKVFKGLENSLEYLHLVDVEFTKVPTEALSVLNQLKYLKLCNTDIRRIPTDSFRGLNSLDELVFCENNVFDGFVDGGGIIGYTSTTTRAAFYGIHKTLKTLVLSRNHLKEVPSVELDILSKLEKLDLSYNNILDVFGRDFRNQTSLKFLDLSHNTGLKIDGNAFDPFNDTLEVLVISNLNLETLPVAVRSLEKLEKLDASNNRFKMIDSDFLGGISAWNFVFIECGIQEIRGQVFKDLYSRLDKKIKLDVRKNAIQKLHFITNTELFSSIDIRRNPLDCHCHELAVSKCPGLVITARCAWPESVNGEKLGSHKFEVEMMKLCAATIADHKHCPKSMTGMDMDNVTKKSSINAARDQGFGTLFWILVFYPILDDVRDIKLLMYCEKSKLVRTAFNFTRCQPFYVHSRTT